MERISFHSKSIKFKLKSTQALIRWIKKVVRSEGSTISELSFVFCDDKFLLKLNQEYLGHETLTDIITFDYSEENLLDGEICISIPRVKENAVKYEITFDNELHRVMIHGVLHLLGYPDKTPSQKSGMRKKEEACLSLLNK